MPFERERIRREFPWLEQPCPGMVVGNDIDGLLSSLLVAHKLGGEIIGFYDYTTVWVADGCTGADLRKAVWMDLDIYQKNIRSIGHHILRFRRRDRIPGHESSLNPNLLRGIYHGSFRQKYPLATFHLLLWYFLEDVPGDDLAIGMAWWPDSTWINGQSHRYRWNVEDWLFNWIPTPTMTGTFPLIERREFERLMRDVLFRRVLALGVTPGRGQVRSRHLKLSGHQCQFRNPNESRPQIERLLALGSEVFGFKIPGLPRRFVPISGKRQSARYPDIRKKWGDFDTFLRKERVFSYAIPNAGHVNYTTGLRIRG